MSDECVIKPSEESRDAYAAYAYALRRMASEIKALGIVEVDAILERYHVEPFEADNILRLGVSFPEDVVKDFQAYWTARGGKV